MANFLISGGAGFLGRELTKKAIGNGHSVTVVDDFSTTSEENFNGNVKVIKKRIEDFDITERFDYVIHLAARPSPEDYISHPVDTILSILHPFNCLLKAIF